MTRYTHKNLTYREDPRGGFNIVREIDYRGRPLTNNIASTGFENVAQEIVGAVNLVKSVRELLDQIYEFSAPVDSKLIETIEDQLSAIEQTRVQS